jgi:hydrogenase-4 component F
MSLTHDQLVVLALIAVSAPLAASATTFLARRRPRFLGGITILFSLLSLGASVLVASGARREFPLRFMSGFFYLDELSIYFVLLVNLVAFVASWYADLFLAFDKEHNAHHSPFQFHLLFNLFHFTMLLVPTVDNLVILWMAVELTTIFSALLVSYRRERNALEAAWKYIMVTTTGIIFALLGTLFLANAITSDTQALLAKHAIAGDPMRWSGLALPEVAKSLNANFMRLSFLFILVGYGTKAGFAPMHTWLPDGHGEAPSPVSALLSGVLLKSALYAILRFYTITNLNQQDNARFTSNILLISGLFSLALATPFILKRNKFKRILAYHSLEHMGIITFGIGVGGSVALFGALLHALNHALTKALMFLTYGNIRREYARRGFESRLENEESNLGAGALKSMPTSGILLALGGLALVGSPPFNIFMSELIILWAAIERALSSRSVGDILAVVLFLITVTLIFGGLVVHLSRLLLDRPPFERGRENLLTVLPLLGLMLVIIVFGFTVPALPVDFPELLRRSTSIVLQGPGAYP